MSVWTIIETNTKHNPIYVYLFELSPKQKQNTALPYVSVWTSTKTNTKHSPTICMSVWTITKTNKKHRTTVCMSVWTITKTNAKLGPTVCMSVRTSFPAGSLAAWDTRLPFALGCDGVAPCC